MTYQVTSPILFITFIKFDTAFAVLEKIREACPKKLYIASDGGRNPEEQQIILDFREKLLQQIDWECEIYTLFEEKNNGCKYGPYNAITWFFDHEEQGIILEDDCLPDNSFFRFCDILLEKYKHEERIFMIGGWNAFDLSPNIYSCLDEDYFFSKYPHIWGWATWRRAWSKYTIDKVDKIILTDLPTSVFKHANEQQYWRKVFKNYKKKKLDAWDYPMLYYILTHHLLCIVPKINMISNIGFNRKDATHTKEYSKFQKLEIKQQKFPLKHPKEKILNYNIDYQNFKITFFQRSNLILRLFEKFKRLFL